MTDDQKKKLYLPSVFERAAAESADSWIKAWVSEHAGTGRVDVEKIFRSSAIEEISYFPHKEGFSRLHLYNGKIVPVKMDVDKLWEKIYTSDFRSAGEPVSLMEVTGTEVIPLPRTPEIGEAVTGEGVYVGRYVLPINNNNPLSGIFNVFAAPEDLPSKASYKTTVQLVGELRNWHGNDGAFYESHKSFLHALETGSYSGGWVIPPSDILRKNLLANRDEIALKGTFADSYYYSSTPHDSNYFSGVNFPDGKEGGFIDSAIPCRPVRLVAVTP